MSSAVKKETYSNEQVRIMMLEQRNEYFIESMDRIEKRFDSIDKRFGSMEKSIVDSRTEVLNKLDKVEKDLGYRIDKLDNRVDSNFKWVLGIIFTQFATLFGVMAHGFHWL